MAYCLSSYRMILRLKDINFPELHSDISHVETNFPFIMCSNNEPIFKVGTEKFHYVLKLFLNKSSYLETVHYFLYNIIAKVLLINLY